MFSDVFKFLFDTFKGPVTWRHLLIIGAVLCIGYAIGEHIGANKQREIYLEREEKRGREIMEEREKNAEERSRLRDEIYALKEELYIRKMSFEDGRSRNQE